MQPRISANPGNPDKKLVEVRPDASIWARAGAWLFRGYIVVAALVALLAGVFTLIWIFVGSD